MDTLAFMVEKWVQAIQDNKPSVRQESIPHAARLVYIYYRSVVGPVAVPWPLSWVCREKCLSDAASVCCIVDDRYVEARSNSGLSNASIARSLVRLGWKDNREVSQ